MKKIFISCPQTSDQYWSTCLFYLKLFSQSRTGVLRQIFEKMSKKKSNQGLLGHEAFAPKPTFSDLLCFVAEFLVTKFFQVPRVFIGGKFIGGGNETAALHQSKELGTMLKEVGAIL